MNAGGRRDWRGRGRQRAAPRGFTLVEMLIAFGVLTLFMAGVFLLFRQGQSAGAQTFWIQKVTAQMRDACKFITLTTARSSYPSAITFPGNIASSAGSNFRMHYSARGVGGTLSAANAQPVTGVGAPGTLFLRFVESRPARFGFGPTETPGSIICHLFSLTRDGRVLYHVTNETTFTAANLPTLGLPAAPTWHASRELVSDVASIGIVPPGTASGALSLTIHCAWPRGHTTRDETCVVVGNVDCEAHAAGADPVAGAW